LNGEDVQQILGRCRQLAISPGFRFDLRRFLLRRLEETQPDLAAKVAALDEAQWARLRDAILSHQAWDW